MIYRRNSRLSNQKNKKEIIRIFNIMGRRVTPDLKNKII